MVYKHQILNVYTAEFESGGELFPSICHRTLAGLVCGQITLIAYLIVQEGLSQPFFLVPLPIWTYFVMQRLSVLYDKSSERLSMERAVQLDRENRLLEKNVSDQFDRFAYRQPVLDPSFATIKTMQNRADGGQLLSVLGREDGGHTGFGSRMRSEERGSSDDKKAKKRNKASPKKGGDKGLVTELGGSGKSSPVESV